MGKSALLFAIALGLTGCGAQVSEESEKAVGTGAALDVFAGPMPDLLVEAHVLQLDGELLELPMQRALHDYARAHPEDSRPWLLLARDSVRREWPSFAVSQYGLAIAADVAATQQPDVLRYLIGVVRDFAGYENEQATQLIRSAWASDALPYVEHAREAAQRAGQKVEAGRLAYLQVELAR